jgi:hypothetical protein
LWAIGFTFVLSSQDVPRAGGPEDTPLPRAAALEAEEPPLTHYRAFRRMHAESERFNQEGWVDAWTEFDGRAFRYEIVREQGSDYIRNKVLKTLLRREQEIIASGGPERAALTAANYEFSEPDRHGEGVRYVLLKPKRKDVLLVDGRMVLSQDGRELLRVEGRLAKNPSFWTSLVNIIRHFARLDGVRVPVSTETIAKVKFAGLSRMQVSYEYESINGRPVSLAARRLMAAAATGR